MQQRKIGPRSECQVIVGDLGCVGPARVDHNDGESLGIALLPFQQALKQHRMTLGGVGADQEGHRAVIKIFVTAGRTVGAEAPGVAGYG